MFGAVLEETIEKFPLPLEELLLHHCLQLQCNSMGINTLVTNGDEGLGNDVMEVSEDRVGSAVFPFLSLLNHSCLPNAIIRFVCIGSFTSPQNTFYYSHCQL